MVQLKPFAQLRLTEGRILLGIFPLRIQPYERAKVIVCHFALISTSSMPQRKTVRRTCFGERIKNVRIDELPPSSFVLSALHRILIDECDPSRIVLEQFGKLSLDVFVDLVVDSLRGTSGSFSAQR